MSTGFSKPLTFSRITPLIPYGYFVQWSVKANESGTYIFELYRSGSVEGPWEPISGPLTNQFSFIDTLTPPQGPTNYLYQKPNQLALGRRFFYRLVCVLPSGKNLTVIDDTDPDLSPLHAQQWRRATVDFGLSVKRQGMLVAVLKRRRWGVRCTRCTDKVTREIIRASCKICWGTAFDGGYWEPMLVYGLRQPASETTTITTEQNSDASLTRFRVPYLPQVEKDDLLISPKDNKRFLVDQQVQTEIGTVTIHQTVTAIELNHDHILYDFPVELQDKKPLI